jgi:muramoyltetrapeptide carboxypeptidase
MLSAFTKFTIANFEEVIFKGTRPLKLTNPLADSAIRKLHPMRTVSRGKATGLLAGGNLSIICSLMGTPFEIDAVDKILFIEDVGEEPYRIDRMLNQLRLAGKFRDARGIVFGECVDCNSNGLNPSKVWDYSLGEVIDNYTAQLGKPVYYGLTFGHTSDQVTIPYGAPAEMNADEQTLTLI